MHTEKIKSISLFAKSVVKQCWEVEAEEGGSPQPYRKWFNVQKDMCLFLLCLFPVVFW